MSQALKAYDSIPAVKQYNTLTMTGTDPELNVFAISQSQLSNTYSFVINVPFGASVIINVAGGSPILANAGFSGAVAQNQILWNFPDAGSLTMTGVGLPGSILAPSASAQLRNGSVTGTVVVGSAVQGADIELYSAPFRIPSSVGARAVAKVDPTWSMTGNVTDDQSATDLTNEAGFIQIDGGPYIAETKPRISPINRVWYTFLPAQVQPKTKPLAVFFNGGPGSATTSLLFAFNTANWTLDPNVVGSNRIVANTAANWGQFANLLYIDAAATGFSYPIANDDGSKADIGIDIDRDAGDFDRVLLRFLRRHPQIMNNRIIIVGESYGGTRATEMLAKLYGYASIVSPTSPYIDLQLNNEETSYFNAVFGTPTPSIAQIATKFGHQALIEPVVAGNYQLKDFTVGQTVNGNSVQFPATNCMTPTCSSIIPGLSGGQTGAMCDDYNCDKPANWSSNLENTAALNLVDLSVLTTAVGANIRNIEWLKPSSRTKAYGRGTGDGDVISAPSLSVAFGTLNAEDNYYLTQNEWVEQGYASGTPNAARTWPIPGSGLIDATAFANNVHNGVSTFITATKFDLIVYTPEIPYGIAHLIFDNPSSTLSALVSSVNYNPLGVTGLPRPGTMSFSYQPSGATNSVITMPQFYSSGHSVTMRAPAELLADVKQWYNTSPH